MKKCFKNVLTALLSCAVLFVTSCNKDEEEPKSAACDITSFSVGEVSWTISGTSITHTYPAGTPDGNLTPAIAVSPGATVNPASGTAQNLFADQGVKYTVTAEDGVTKKEYTAKATRIQQSTACDIVTFTVDGVEWTLVNDTVFTHEYPRETVEGPLTPTIVLLPGATVNPASGTAQNLFVPGGFKYTVTAEDGVTKKVYTAIATRTMSVECAITSFAVGEKDWVIQGDSLIIGTYPAGTDPNVIKSLTPTVTVSDGATVFPLSGEVQDFSTENGVLYTVTAEDGVTVTEYTVKAVIAAYAEADILSFAVEGTETVVIDGTDITLTFPAGTAPTALTPEIVVSSGATVEPASGVEHDGFFTAEGVTYTVTSEDGLKTETYTVKATVVPYTEADIVTFAVENASVYIEGTNITLAFPAGTVPGPLTPTVTPSPGATVDPASGEARDGFFTAEGVSYTVTAEDGITTKTYTVKAILASYVWADRTGWTAEANGGILGWPHLDPEVGWGGRGTVNGVEYIGGNPMLVLDGDLESGWHSAENIPTVMVVNMQETKTVSSLKISHVLGAMTGGDDNGWQPRPEWVYFEHINVYVSNTPFNPNGDDELSLNLWGEPVRYDRDMGSAGPFEIDLPTPLRGQYLILEFEPHIWISFAELEVYVQE
jgi:hypothetical protein